MPTVEVTRWDSCYDDSWSGVISPESFAHPAKFSRGLIERIYRHCLGQGYLKKGDMVGDCFGGVGCGGIIAAYAGLRWVGVELESRFVEMAKWNFELHTGHWRTLGLPFPQIIQGDSRRFDELIGQAAGIVSSPPFVDSLNVRPSKQVLAGSGGRMGQSCKGEDNYGTTPGQIGSLPAGEVSAVVSSPPYAETELTSGGEKIRKEKSILPKLDGYGSSNGNIGRLKGGTLAGVCTSPPYAQSVCSNGATDDPPPTDHGIERPDDYGRTDGQIGKLWDGTGRKGAAHTGETYWQACASVYQACFRAIKPNGILVLVLKDYVKDRQRVPLSDDTVTLCESLGFTLIERIQAMLVSETRHADLFNGEDVKRTERKSFFRRLAEKNGSPRIDHEDMLIFRRRHAE